MHQDLEDVLPFNTCNGFSLAGTIVVKELILVVLSAALLGHQCVGKVVQFVVDKKAVVDVLNTTFCSDTHTM